MTAEDIMAMKAMSEGTDMSSYEHFKIANDSAKRPSGTSIAAITIGSAALLTGIGAWIFGPVMANNARKCAEREVDRLAAFGLAERQERIGHQNIIQRTVIDVAAGASAGAGAGALANAAATAAAMQNAGNPFSTFGGSVNGLPTGGTIPVSLWQAPTQCCCPTPCGCQG
mgnify:CR=1 FL=1